MNGPGQPTDPWLAGLKRLRIEPAEIAESFSRSPGPGGQNVNKVSTAVTLRYRDLAVTACDSRSQARNRQIARFRLLAAIDARRKSERAAKKAEREKERRRNAPRPPGLKRRILEAKRQRSETKKFRRQPGRGEE
jgi:ribosome-associated protein